MNGVRFVYAFLTVLQDFSDYLDVHISITKYQIIVTVTRMLWVRYQLEGMNYYFFVFYFFFALAPRQKPVVAFRHATRNASIKSRECGEQSVLRLVSVYRTVNENGVF